MNNKRSIKSCDYNLTKKSATRWSRQVYNGAWVVKFTAAILSIYLYSFKINVGHKDNWVKVFGQKNIWVEKFVTKNKVNFLVKIKFRSEKDKVYNGPLNIRFNEN